MSNMNNWLEQANEFSAKLNDCARNLEKAGDTRFVELDMLSMAVFDVAAVIRYFASYTAVPEETYFEFKARLERALKVASRYSSPEAEKVRKAIIRVSSKLLELAL